MACAHLRRAGLRTLLRNFRCREGEIDLVMLDTSDRQAPVLVCVEVRYRRSRRFGGAAASVTPAKQQRLIRAAGRLQQQWHRTPAYPQHRYAGLPVRFDVVALEGPPDAVNLCWLRGAFDAVR